MDGAYDTCPDDDADLVLPLSVGGSVAVPRPPTAKPPGPPRKPVGALAQSTPLGTPRRVNFGARATWDMPLGHALDLAATQADQLLLSAAAQARAPFPAAVVVFEPPPAASAAAAGGALVPRVVLNDPLNGATDGFMSRGGIGFGQLLAHIAALMVRARASPC